MVLGRKLSLTQSALKSDVTINASKFADTSISKQTHTSNEKLLEIGQRGPLWYEVGAENYRQMRWNGETPLPKPSVIDSGMNSEIPSRDAGRQIPVRIFTPQNGTTKGVFLHVHGGGWVLGGENYSDPYLKTIADAAQLTVVSVGYRLAPEHPFPAGPHDCEDVSEWLVDNSPAQYGASLLFAGGESAGGQLATLLCFHLIRSRPNFQFRGLVLNFGAYDLSGFLPQAKHFSKLLVLNGQVMQKYIEAYLPGTTEEQRRDPSISPFYADLKKLASSSIHRALPPALFTCGTEDCLLDDSVLFGTKWAMSGAESIIKIYPGGPHGLVHYSPEMYEGAGQSLEDVKTFLSERVARP